MLADKLNELIKETGLTNYKIAQQTGISEASLSQYCNNKIKKPRIARLKKLADFFDVDVSVFTDSIDDDNHKIHAKDTQPQYKPRYKNIENKISELEKRFEKLEIQLQKSEDERNKLIDSVKILIDIININSTKDKTEGEISTNDNQ